MSCHVINVAWTIGYVKIGQERPNLRAMSMLLRSEDGKREDSIQDHVFCEDGDHKNLGWFNITAWCSSKILCRPIPPRDLCIIMVEEAHLGHYPFQMNWNICFSGGKWGGVSGLCGISRGVLARLPF